ncbi:SWIM zinc finger family protein [Halosimplex pelagicum]|uniref:SWIM zinc finger family protein n=1 Tax=Halosimplex pelagicum TaxID=869886 RepID=A0A7D5TDA7_9EURY|nr:SWIM zinc finger family protein [Halosimplex pelagicum]QLH83753.1 SWIM zinc finger family protein [Halosimplex pelagicum]
MDSPTQEEIRSLCTDQSFERGRDYYRQGRVRELDIDDDEITATVRGSDYYDVAIEIGTGSIRTRCSCPYDYAGDCKHIVAVLLAVDDRNTEVTSDAEDADEALSDVTDIDALVERTAAADLRTFLLDIIEDNRDVRDRFVAFTGGDTGKTVYDYKQEIDRLFEDATGSRGIVEYDTHIDFSQYYDLAETHRKRDHIDAATDIYQAIAETIRENLNRVDDSGGYYGTELERAIESYAETVVERNLDHEQKQPYIEYLCQEFIEADHGVASDYYDDALRTLCTATADLEYWLELLNSRVSSPALDTVTSGEQMPAHDEYMADHAAKRHGERAADFLYTSDFTEGPLTTDDFTGGTLDIEHPAVGPLKLEYFVGDAFESLRVDDPTTIEEHTVDIEPTESHADEAEISSSLRTQRVLSTYIYLLNELGETEAVASLYEEVYLESPRFCKEYAERLRDDGNEERAIEVIEDGIDTFDSTRDLRWLAADLYEDRNPERYRATLKELFLNHTQWAAYDDLKDSCDSREWQSLWEEFQQQFADDRQQRIALYVHDGDLEEAFRELKDSDDLSVLKRYRDTVARVDPEEYFERYRELLVPFAAGDTGRRHYREVADHLREMQGLVPDERFEEFVDFLKDKHSNRPAFIDELENAGF